MCPGVRGLQYQIDAATKTGPGTLSDGETGLAGQHAHRRRAGSGTRLGAPGAAGREILDPGSGASGTPQ